MNKKGNLKIPIYITTKRGIHNPIPYIFVKNVLLGKEEHKYLLTSKCIHEDSLTYRPSSQGWAPRVLPFLFCLLCSSVARLSFLLMFVYVWVGLGLFLSLLTSTRML